MARLDSLFSTIILCLPPRFSSIAIGSRHISLPFIIYLKICLDTFIYLEAFIYLINYSILIVMTLLIIQYYHIILFNDVLHSFLVTTLII